ncbi:MAG: CoB--CoM heterodisulfide reductase subunit C [Candidatus Lokiarchaeota archaeon]|nr:CoB--CoM heterodisulfide reductase subunit C [Candidatus Lokiarchaeota archaeon]MBD3339165.1 CoB--CoM heterodisulfide reductase subunit C [Candidatus Lokiarchaeota archaeon]
MSDNVEKYIKRPKGKSISSEISQKFVDAGLEKIRACINCGTCTGGCPSGRRTAYRTRSAIRKALTGDESVLSDIDIWFCSTCYYCYERCPRDIPVTDMIIKLRNIAVEEGYILDSHFGLANDIFYETGHGVPANGEANKKWQDLRESYGLPPLPPTVHSHPDAVKECQTLMKEVGFKDLMDHAKKLKQKRAKEAEKKAEVAPEE